MMERGKVLDDAKKCICGGRETDYGTPEQSFTKIAGLWSAFLDVKISPSKAAVMMSLFKIGRIATGQTKDDNYVDGCGYLGVAAELAETDDDEACFEGASEVIDELFKNTNDLEDAIAERSKSIALELHKGMCSAFDNRCATCPASKNKNETGLTCTEFRLAFPEKAFEMMQLALKEKSEKERVQIAFTPENKEIVKMFFEYRMKMHCADDTFSGGSCCLKCPLSVSNNWTNLGCHAYCEEHPEKAAKIMEEFLNAK